MATLGSDRTWWLFRKLDAERTLFFPVVVVVEEDEPGLFGGTIAGLDDRLAASGATADEAEFCALGLFQGLIDHGLAKSQIDEILKDSKVQRHTLQLSFTEVDQWDCGNLKVAAVTLAELKRIANGGGTAEERIAAVNARLDAATAKLAAAETDADPTPDA